MADRIWEQFAEIARSLKREPTLEATMLRAAETAVELIDSCDLAGVSIVHRRGAISPAAWTDELARRGDELQYELQEGPNFDLLTEHDFVQCDDLSAEERWPAWSRRVRDEFGIRNVLCLRLFVTDRAVGALSLYSKGPSSFDADDLRDSLALAGHVAVAMTTAQAEEHLNIAVRTRTAIGIAEGRLMQRFDLTEDQAFAVLTRASQHSNRKLAAIADDIARHGIRPDLLA